MLSILIGFLFSGLISMAALIKKSLSISGAFAATNADTWASELGILSRTKPISILNFKLVEKGVSGAISILGTISAALGGGFVAVVFFIGYVLKFGFSSQAIVFFIIVVILGFMGCIIDSLLGELFKQNIVVKSVGK